MNFRCRREFIRTYNSVIYSMLFTNRPYSETDGQRILQLSAARDGAFTKRAGSNRPFINLCKGPLGLLCHELLF